LAQARAVAVTVADTVAIARAIAGARTEAIALADLAAGVVDEIAYVDSAGEVGYEWLELPGDTLHHGLARLAEIDVEASGLAAGPCDRSPYRGFR
jgi:hypothetical protein